jgi:hypothetical protein
MRDKANFSLLYVSQSLLDRSRATAEVENIVRVSQSRNAVLSVTGALIFTEVHFAQLLEGPRENVDALMASICNDHRHKDVTVLERNMIPARRFTDWSLAYSGPASYVAEAVEEALAEVGDDAGNDVDRLINIMIELARPSYGH